MAAAASAPVRGASPPTARAGRRTAAVTAAKAAPRRLGGRTRTTLCRAPRFTDCPSEIHAQAAVRHLGLPRLSPLGGNARIVRRPTISGRGDFVHVSSYFPHCSARRRVGRRARGADLEPCAGQGGGGCLGDQD